MHPQLQRRHPEARTFENSASSSEGQRVDTASETVVAAAHAQIEALVEITNNFEQLLRDGQIPQLCSELDLGVIDRAFAEAFGSDNASTREDAKALRDRSSNLQEILANDLLSAMKRTRHESIHATTAAALILNNPLNKATFIKRDYEQALRGRISELNHTTKVTAASTNGTTSTAEAGAVQPDRGSRPVRARRLRRETVSPEVGTATLGTLLAEPSAHVARQPALDDTAGQIKIARASLLYTVENFDLLLQNNFLVREIQTLNLNTLEAARLEAEEDDALLNELATRLQEAINSADPVIRNTARTATATLLNHPETKGSSFANRHGPLLRQAIRDAHTTTFQRTVAGMTELEAIMDEWETRVQAGAMCDALTLLETKLLNLPIADIERGLEALCEPADDLTVVQDSKKRAMLGSLLRGYHSLVSQLEEYLRINLENLSHRRPDIVDDYSEMVDRAADIVDRIVNGRDTADTRLAARLRRDIPAELWEERDLFLSAEGSDTEIEATRPSPTILFDDNYEELVAETRANALAIADEARNLLYPSSGWFSAGTPDCEGAARLFEQASHTNFAAVDEFATDWIIALQAMGRNQEAVEIYCRHCRGSEELEQQLLDSDVSIDPSAVASYLNSLGNLDAGRLGESFDLVTSRARTRIAPLDPLDNGRGLQQALTLAEEAVKIAPSGDTYYNLVLREMQLGYLTQAEQHLTRYLQSYENHPGLNFLMGLCAYADENRRDEDSMGVSAWFQKAYDNRPTEDTPNANYTRAAIAYMLNTVDFTYNGIRNDELKECIREAGYSVLDFDPNSMYAEGHGAAELGLEDWRFILQSLSVDS